MSVLLPMFLERLVQLIDDQSDLSVLTQKQILKIFFTFTQVIFQFYKILIHTVIKLCVCTRFFYGYLV